MGIAINFSLINDGLFIFMDKFYRIFYCDDMTTSIADYNNKVDTEQIEQGRLNTSELMGSKLPKAAWHDEMKESK